MSPKFILTLALFGFVALAFVQAIDEDVSDVDEVQFIDEVELKPNPIPMMPRISCQVGGEGACVIRCIRLGRKSGYCRSGICYCTR